MVEENKEAGTLAKQGSTSEFVGPEIAVRIPVPGQNGHK